VGSGLNRLLQKDSGLKFVPTDRDSVSTYALHPSKLYGVTLTSDRIEELGG